MNGPLFIPDQPPYRLARLRNDPLYFARNAMRQIPFHRPSIGPDEEREVLDTLRSGWITTGPKAKRFEKEFAAYVGARTRAGGLALHRRAASRAVRARHRPRRRGYHHAVHVHRHRRSDRLPRRAAGVRRYRSWHLQHQSRRGSRRRSKAASIKRVRAILPVHFAGHACDMDRMLAIARGHQSENRRRRGARGRFGAPSWKAAGWPGSAPSATSPASAFTRPRTSPAPRAA